MTMQQLFMAHGRVGRLQYFLTGIAIAIISWIPAVATVSTDPVTGQGSFHPIGWLALLVGTVAHISNTARRCHDINKSGFYQLLTMIPLIGLVIYIQLLFESGTPGTNQYGPPTGAVATNEKAMARRMERIEETAAQSNGPASEYYNEDGSFNMDGIFQNSNK